VYNQLDGACARFLTARKKNVDMPYALFVTGDSGLNIRNGNAFATEKDKQITKCVFGGGAKDVTVLGKGVYRQYGVAENGFQISSCQFAMHYFFENKVKFHEFIRNLTECTKVNGYFIGTCYDGKLVFDLLRNKKTGEGVSIFKNDRKIYEINKMYDETGFPDDEMSLGYAVNVYQESINQMFREYLVNFDYFIQVMEDYGFVLIPKEDAHHMGLPNETGLFSELFMFMQNEVKRNPKKRADYGTSLQMTAEEKQISFMNRYFVFKKVRNVDAKKMSAVILKQAEMVYRVGEENMADLEKMGEEVVVLAPVRKLKKAKLVLKKYVPPTDSPTDQEPVEITQLQPAAGPPMKIKIRVPKK